MPCSCTKTKRSIGKQKSIVEMARLVKVDPQNDWYEALIQATQFLKSRFFCIAAEISQQFGANAPAPQPIAPSSSEYPNTYHTSTHDPRLIDMTFDPWLMTPRHAWESTRIPDGTAATKLWTRRPPSNSWEFSFSAKAVKICLKMDIPMDIPMDFNHFNPQSCSPQGSLQTKAPAIVPQIQQLVVKMFQVLGWAERLRACPSYIAARDHLLRTASSKYWSL